MPALALLRSSGTPRSGELFQVIYRKLSPIRNPGDQSKKPGRMDRWELINSQFSIIPSLFPVHRSLTSISILNCIPRSPFPVHLSLPHSQFSILNQFSRKSVSSVSSVCYSFSGPPPHPKNKPSTYIWATLILIQIR